MTEYTIPWSELLRFVNVVLRLRNEGMNFYACMKGTSLESTISVLIEDETGEVQELLGLLGFPL